MDGDPVGWIDDAVVYQVYLRSFADGDGDGVGDLDGLRKRLDHVVSLGVDAVWLSPCFASPQVDHGYDVADYRHVDPLFGTNEDLVALIDEAHRRGVRVLLDLVPNHCSTQHEWFQEALAAGPRSPARSRFHFRDGRGVDGQLPPNNWSSVFGGPAWTRTSDGQWYLHSFDASQPDLNWDDPAVVAMMEDVLRFWLVRGVDGFRVDVAHGLVKHPDLADWDGPAGSHNAHMWNRDGVHEVYRRWREVVEEFGAALVGEVWVPDPHDLARYVSDDELGQAFCFDLMVQPWHAPAILDGVCAGLRPGAAWVLDSHDVHRSATRYGQRQVLTAPDPTDMLAAARRDGPADEVLGRRRATAATLLMLALPGATYLYQGQELGLPEVLDLPDELRQDPMWRRSGGRQRGRDGCRVPLPWTRQGPSLGFGPTSGWLPQPSGFADLAVEVQSDDEWSALSVLRRAVPQRRSLFDGPSLTWLDVGPDVLAFRRGHGVCVLTVGTEARLDPGWGRLVASSVPVSGGTVPADACVWLSVAVGDGVSPSPPPASAGTTKES